MNILVRKIQGFCAPTHPRDAQFFRKYTGRFTITPLVCLLFVMGMFISLPTPLVFIFIFGATLTGWYSVNLMLVLRKEFSVRKYLRSKRLALPGLLADGIAALERGDYQKAAKAVHYRLNNEEMNMGSIYSGCFDVLLYDYLDIHPEVRPILMEVVVNMGVCE